MNRTHRLASAPMALMALMALAALSLPFVSCSGGAKDVAATDIVLDQGVMALTVGGVPGRLAATVYPDHATNKAVVWASSDDSVATAAGHARGGTAQKSFRFCKRLKMTAARFHDRCGPCTPDGPLSVSGEVNSPFTYSGGPANRCPLRTF